MRHVYLVVFLLVLLLPVSVLADTIIINTTPGSDGFFKKDTFENWDVKRAAESATAVDTAGNTVDIYLYGWVTEPQFYYFQRVALQYNTSVLDDDITINSAVIGAYLNSKSDTLPWSPGTGISHFAPSTPGTIGIADWNDFGDLESTIVPYASNSAWTNWTLNSDGKASINKTGWSSFMLRDTFDINNTAPAWGNQKYFTFAFFGADYSDGIYAPRLYVDYTPAAGGDPPVASFTKSKTLVVFPSTVTFDDTSTNTPTSWSWDMGDGRAAVTTENPTYQYLKRGLFKVILTATNDNGSDASDPQYVWVTGFPMFAQVSPYKNISYYYSLEDATFSSSRELSEQETLTVLRNMYGV